MHTYIHMSKIRQYAAELLMTERAFMPFDWHRYSGPCSNVRYLGNSTHLCLLTYLLSRPIFPGAIIVRARSYDCVHRAVRNVAGS